MLDSLRSWAGYKSTADPPKKQNATLEKKLEAAGNKSLLERLSKQLKTQTIQIEGLRDELEEVKVDLAVATRAKNVPVMTTKVTRKKELEAEIGTMEKKRVNTRAQLRKLQVADANLEQALLIKDGATELQETVNAMDEIGLEDAVDKMQDAAAQVNEHDALLAGDIMGGAGGGEVLDPEDINAEIQKLLDAQDAGLLAQLPEITPAAKVKITTKGTVTTPVTVAPLGDDE